MQVDEKVFVTFCGFAANTEVTCSVEVGNSSGYNVLVSKSVYTNPKVIGNVETNANDDTQSK